MTLVMTWIDMTMPLNIVRFPFKNLEHIHMCHRRKFFLQQWNNCGKWIYCKRLQTSTKAADPTKFFQLALSRIYKNIFKIPVFALWSWSLPKSKQLLLVIYPIHPKYLINIQPFEFIQTNKHNLLGGDNNATYLNNVAKLQSAQCWRKSKAVVFSITEEWPDFQTIINKIWWSSLTHCFLLTADISAACACFMRFTSASNSSWDCLSACWHASSTLWILVAMAWATARCLSSSDSLCIWHSHKDRFLIITAQCYNQNMVWVYGMVIL